MEKIINHLEFLKTSSKKTCHYLSRKEGNSIQLFCLGMLMRISDIATSSKVLFELLPKNKQHEFSIGIMYRVLILDTLISMNIYNQILNLERDNKTIEEIENVVNLFCNNYLSDGISETLSYIELAESLQMRTKAETEITFKKIGVLFKPFFDNYSNDGSKPKLKKEYKSKHNAKVLFENLAKNNRLKEISKIYDSYAYLSKYDHFGIVYYHAINEKLNTKIKLYSKATDAFIAHHAFIHVILARHSSNDIFINNQKDTANDYLMKNVHKQNNS